MHEQTILVLLMNAFEVSMYPIHGLDKTKHTIDTTSLLLTPKCFNNVWITIEKGTEKPIIQGAVRNPSAKTKRDLFLVAHKSIYITLVVKTAEFISSRLLSMRT